VGKGSAGSSAPWKPSCVTEHEEAEGVAGDRATEDPGEWTRAGVGGRRPARKPGAAVEPAKSGSGDEAGA
jgi:hypothetical protein